MLNNNGGEDNNHVQHFVYESYRPRITPLKLTKPLTFLAR